MKLTPSTESRSSATTLVTRDEVQRYGTDGFVAIDRAVLAADEVATIRGILDRLYAGYTWLPESAGRDIGALNESGTVPEIVWTTRLSRTLLRTSGFRRLNKVAAELLGVSRVRLHFDHAIFKPARSGGKTAWHQDVAFDPDHDCPVATIWLALVRTSPDNGCMRFIPGSQLGGIKPHLQVGRHGLEAQEMDDADAVDCPLPAGGMSVHMQRTLHGSGRNSSDEVRAGWILKFIPDDRGPLVRAAGAVRDGLRYRSGAGRKPDSE